MNPITFTERVGTLNVLCIGAHSDDIEIGAGGFILSLLESELIVNVRWCVLSAPGARATEARQSAEDFLKGAAAHSIELGDFEDTQFPDQRPQIKAWLARIRDLGSPDLVLVHRADDAHQDHRTLNELAWNMFRDHTILEYEVPKWDGDFGRPNAYAALTQAVLERKLELLERNFASQRSRDWFDPETFRGLARLRGMECRAPERFAEAFSAPKIRLV
ncbi:PIG-L deacetylase family protein [Qingshengfaniella alkalisoli]|uniref:PIG-L family deacetylase n=1 Tax=Qingshengfaniella alkalisoli TaxID=2599296 RepID=A0A5B8IXM1_9RHOB|nr:PIG-L deacetylase family protein [Qingshengfaniella alkalisoli]QDY70474.1 PIG-L family deacetylase [Qingshengfaniella alkalisoli]